ncbi:MAG: phage GP46 family protein [Alphaproteobacteria bacterium]|nr:phage GP46 family protein [Alphaproteobacteria bacterium]
MKMVTLENGLVDIGRNSAGALLSESTLQTAVLISLLTERRAEPDDRLPTPARADRLIPPDRKGWAGDGFDGRRIGSRLWLLQREKQTPETLRRAISYAREALQWLIDDAHVNSIDVQAAWSSIGRLDMKIRAQLPGGGTFETSISSGIVYAL